MAFSNQTPTLLAGIPPVLPPQDRALSWACSICVHTLALAVASVAAVGLREFPQAPASVFRMEILLSGAQHEAAQATATDPQREEAPERDQELADLLEDSSRVLESLSRPVRSASEAVVNHRPLSESPGDPQPARHPAPAAPEATAVASTSGDPFPIENSTPIERRSEPPDAANEPDRHPPRPVEAVKQAELTTATSSALEPTAQNVHDRAEPSPQREEASSSPTAPTPMVDSQTGSSGSPTAPSAETADTVAMAHPALAQTVSARSDYAWLLELLMRRLMSLQSYPNSARPQGWEGVVVVKTTINSNGGLVDAVVTKSSGHSALDEDAVRLMHRVCPVHLPQDLGKSKISVLIPVRYRLER